MRKLLTALSVFCLLASACGKQNRETEVTSVSVNPTSKTLIVGETVLLSATVSPSNATSKSIVWKSSAPAVASVNNAGLVTALQSGTASILASCGGQSATCSVTVQEQPKASALALDKEPFTVAIGQSVTVTVSATPADAVCRYEWSSSDARISTVKGDGVKGVIETKDFGVATITVKESRSGLSASLTVCTSVSGFTWTVDSGETYEGAPLVTIEKEKTYQLPFTCTPASATKLFADLSQWEFQENGKAVEKPTLISIDENGMVTAIQIGILRMAPQGRISAKEGAGILYIKVKAADVNADGDNEDVDFEDWN